MEKVGVEKRSVNKSGAGFRVFVAMSMAASALSIDSVLPAFANIRSELGLATGSPATAGLITAFLIGLAVGQIPTGLLSDRYGRRPLLWLSAAVFLLGIGGMALSTTLTAMVISRFVWGIGAAGLRTTAVSMIRDRFVGAQMAREISFVMAVFLIVPIFAPTASAAIITDTSWRPVLLLSGVFGVALAVVTFFVPETLDRANQQPLQVAQLGVACRAIVANRNSLRFAALLTVIFGVFGSYLASSERIVGDVFRRKAQFPLLYGGVAVAMGLTSLLVARYIEQLGLVRAIRIAIGLYVIASVLTCLVSFTGRGIPAFWVFWISLASVLALHNIVFANTTAAAMVPLGHIAGTAGAVIGTVSTAIGALVGLVIDRAFDSTVRPISVAFMVSGFLAIALVWSITDE